MTIKYRKNLLLLSVAVFLLLTPLILFYTMGYRLGNGWSLAKTGGIYIYSPLSGSEIFLNNNIKKETNILQNGIFIQSLKPNFYTVLVAKEGYWPWQKELEIKSQMVTEARAFLIPQQMTGETLIRGSIVSILASPFDHILLLEENKREAARKITFYLPDSKEFLTNDSTITTKNLSSLKIAVLHWEDGKVFIETEKTLIKAEFNFDTGVVTASNESNDKNLSVSVYHGEEANQKELDAKYDKHKKIKIWMEEDNEIWIEWMQKDTPLPYYLTEEKEMIFKAKSFIKGFDFFPQREDLFIFAVENGVFAMEIDGRGNRNMHPIYKGKDPTFAIFPNQKNIYVLDNGVLSKIEL